MKFCFLFFLLLLLLVRYLHITVGKYKVLEGEPWALTAHSTYACKKISYPCGGVGDNYRVPTRRSQSQPFTYRRAKPTPKSSTWTGSYLYEGFCPQQATALTTEPWSLIGQLSRSTPSPGDIPIDVIDLYLFTDTTANGGLPYKGL
ncbi:hypothetical protein F5X98DRAFT_122159 [Xylaria grammica]|nr:hypothetical protein F5X98DRAFT_122159 [Xylaria grammica]